MHTIPPLSKIHMFSAVSGCGKYRIVGAFPCNDDAIPHLVRVFINDKKGTEQAKKAMVQLGDFLIDEFGAEITSKLNVPL